MKKSFTLLFSAMGLSLSIAASPLLQQNVLAEPAAENTVSEDTDTEKSVVSAEPEKQISETDGTTVETTEETPKQKTSDPEKNEPAASETPAETPNAVEDTPSKDSGYYPAKQKNGFYKENGVFRFYENGKLSEKNSDIVYGNINGTVGWYYIEKGVANLDYTGVKNNVHGWWYVKNGKVDFSYNGFAENEYGWWYIEKGNVTFKKNDVIYGTVNGEKAWWNVKGSNVKFNESVESNQYGWWYIKDGKVIFSYTGFAKNPHGWWYIEKGNVTFKKNDVIYGTVNGEKAWWNVKGSNVKFNESVEQNRHGWWYTKDGKVDFNYTGPAANAYGLWYIQKGNVRFDANGWKSTNGKKYYVKKGLVSTGITKVSSDYYIFDDKTGSALPNTKKTLRNTYYETDSNGKIVSVEHKIKTYINQLNTFGKYPMACAAAASLMAMQANGYAESLSGQSGWDSLIASFRAVRGISFGNRYGVGVTYAYQLKNCIAKNPATASVPTYTATGGGITLTKIMDNLTHGQTFVPLVKLKSSTHWIAVTGWYKNGSTTMFRIADPWPKDGKPATNYVSNVFNRADAFYSDKLSGTELMEIIKAPIIYDWHGTAQSIFIGSYMNF